MRSAWFFAVLSLAVTTGCSKDPETLKREYVASGDRYVAANKLPEAIIQYRNALAKDPRVGETHFKLAEALLTVGDTSNAYKEFARAADLLPDNAGVQLRTGQMYLVTGHYPEARDRAAAILKVDPKNAAGLLLMGNALAGLKQLDQAVDLVSSAIDEDPKQTLTYANLAALQSAKGDTKAAEAAFKRGIAVDPQSASAHAGLANYYWAAGRTSEAEQELMQARALAPQEPALIRAQAAFYAGTGNATKAEQYMKEYASVGGTGAKLALADTYLAGGRAKDAANVLEPLAHTTEAFAAASMRLALAHYLTGDSQLAYSTLDSVLKQEPKNVQAILLKAGFLLKDRKPQDALTLADAALQQIPASPRGLYVKALALQQTGAPAEAIKTLQKLLTVNPSHVPAQELLANLYLSQGNPGPASELAAQVIRRQPQSWTAHLIVARAALASGRVKDAETETSMLLKANPDSYEAHTLRGDLSFRARDFSHARESYTRALELKPRAPQALAGLMRINLETGKTAEARQLADSFYDSGVTDPGLAMLAGATYAVTGEEPKAEVAFQKAIELDPSRFDAYLALGRLYFKQDRLDSAREKYEEAAVHRPEVAVASKTIVGIILASQGKRAEARKVFQDVLVLDPRAPVAANNLAWDYAEANENLDQALQLAQTARAGLPDNSQVSDTLGWVYYKKGLSTLAISTFREAVAKDPKNAQLHYHLGLAYLKNGDKGLAQQSLREALKTPGFSDAQSAREALASIG